jgi:hypothetical protein
MSEFSLVIGALGVSLGHIEARTVALLTFIFVITSVASTYMINGNHAIQQWMGAVLRRLGFKDSEHGVPADDDEGAADHVLVLGFFRDTSSILHQLELSTDGGDPHPLLRRLLIVDFNPVVLRELERRGVKCLYGDLASVDTLHHAAVAHARLVVSTLTDTILKGTTNQRLLKQARNAAPQAEVVVASDTITGALQLYEDGADFVFIPRIHSAEYMAGVLSTAAEDGLRLIREEEVARLRQRNEVLA